MSTWLPRVAKVLDVEVPSLPELVSIQVWFEGYAENMDGDEELPSHDGVKGDINVCADRDTNTISIRVGRKFELGLAQPFNVSEAALVGAIVDGCLELADQTASVSQAAVLNSIVRNQDARDSHLFQARHFRDFVAEQLTGQPIGINATDEANLRLGLGWRVRSHAEISTFEGRRQCNEFLNELVADLEKGLCGALRQFDRKSMIEMALRNHEVAMVHQARWRRTASAIVALHCDRDAALQTIAEQGFENNRILQASRVLVELAVCECPLTGGLIAGEMDFSLLMAELMLLTTLGDWSDAIYHGGMQPKVVITPIGDIDVESSFFNDVLKPFGHLSSDSIIETSIADYARNFTTEVAVPEAESKFVSEFTNAWFEEKHVGIDAFRRFVDQVEDLGIRRNEPVICLRHSELLELCNEDDDTSKRMIGDLTTSPRPCWFEVPPEMEEKDRWPWRYRRQLSLLRRPIVQLDDEPDPLLVIAPGLLRDGFVYSAENYHEGYFPPEQLKSTAMMKWRGDAAVRRGRQFAQEVANRMAELGWDVEPEIKLTKVLRKQLDRDYGDIDVLAWNQKTARVLLIECKDVHFHKTAGEIAEQLSKFQGKLRNGKRDRLRKHLDRCTIMRDNVQSLAKFVGTTTSPAIEGWVVFRNPVPMLLAWEEITDAVSVTTLGDLHEI